jgi:hypothetical protein
MLRARSHSGTIIEAAGWRSRMEVAAWLRGLGLGQYESRFRESEIDPDVLTDSENLSQPLRTTKANPQRSRRLASMGVNYRCAWPRK